MRDAQSGDLSDLGHFIRPRRYSEFGCGTGAFAAMLLNGYLPSDCRYVGIDVSPKMVRLASSRLATWRGRTEVRFSEGSPRLPESDGAFDRFVSNYVFDLLAPEYAATVIAEAYRVLSSGGKLCLVSLGRGRSGLPRVLTTLWERCGNARPSGLVAVGL